MIYNMDFLISAMVILLLILWHFLGQKRAEDLNNRYSVLCSWNGRCCCEFFTNYVLFHTTAIWDLRSHRDNDILSAAGLASVTFICTFIIVCAEHHFS